MSLVFDSNSLCAITVDWFSRWVGHRYIQTVRVS